MIISNIETRSILLGAILSIFVYIVLFVILLEVGILRLKKSELKTPMFSIFFPIRTLHIVKYLFRNPLGVVGLIMFLSQRASLILNDGIAPDSSRFLDLPLTKAEYEYIIRYSNNSIFVSTNAAEEFNLLNPLLRNYVDESFLIMSNSHGPYYAGTNKHIDGIICRRAGRISFPFSIDMSVVLCYIFKNGANLNKKVLGPVRGQVIKFSSGRVYAIRIESFSSADERFISDIIGSYVMFSTLNGIERFVGTPLFINFIEINSNWYSKFNWSTVFLSSGLYDVLTDNDIESKIGLFLMENE